jgi:hypothetical protein
LGNQPTKNLCVLRASALNSLPEISLRSMR